MQHSVKNFSSIAFILNMYSSFYINAEILLKFI